MIPVMFDSMSLLQSCKNIANLPHNHTKFPLITTSSKSYNLMSHYFLYLGHLHPRANRNNEFWLFCCQKDGNILSNHVEVQIIPDRLY